MESLSQVLGGLGMLDILTAVALGFLMLLVLPWLALSECARSCRRRDLKTLLIVGLVLTWGIGSLLYGLFFTRSWALRIVTVCSLVLFLVVAIPSAISLGTGLDVAAQLDDEQESARFQRLVDEFQPFSLSSGVLEP